jgi:hypothetical protein
MQPMGVGGHGSLDRSHDHTHDIRDRIAGRGGTTVGQQDGEGGVGDAGQVGTGR